MVGRETPEIVCENQWTVEFWSLFMSFPTRKDMEKTGSAVSSQFVGEKRPGFSGSPLKCPTNGWTIYWLVVDLPPWKIWKSDWIIIPTIGENKSHVPVTTNQSMFRQRFLGFSTLKIFRSPALSVTVTTMINHFRTWRGYQKKCLSQKRKEQPVSNASIKSPIVAAEMSQHVGRWVLDFSNIPSPRSDFVVLIQWTTVDHGWRVLDYGI